MSSLFDKSFNSSFSNNTLNKTQILKDLNEISINEINTNELNNENINQAKAPSSFPKIDNNKLINKYEEKDKINDKEKKMKFRISKGAESFSFSKFGVNNMKLKTVKRIEDIRNRYMNKKKDVKFDETLEIEQDINILLVLIMLLINFSLMILQIGEVAKNNNNIPRLLLMITIENFLINFIIHRVICIFIAFTLPKLYGKKKRNCCYKLIFNVFYEKYIRYLYRIRLLIAKYQKELNFIEK